jgi:hypothetical protein
MSGGTFSVRVIDEDGKGIESATVCCDYGFLNGIEDKYTDEDGWVRWPHLSRQLFSKFKVVFPYATIL